MGCGIGKHSTNSELMYMRPMNARASTSSKTQASSIIQNAPKQAEIAFDVNDLKFRAGQFIQYHKGSFYNTYRTLKELGHGGFGHVYLAEHRSTKQHRAVKEIEKAKACKSSSGNTKFIREVEILAKLDHPNILRLFELFEDNFRYYVVSEVLTGGELFNYIVASNHLSESVAAKIMAQVLSAVNFCHINSIVHRDLKPENLMLEVPVTNPDEIHIKLIDFGTSCLYDPTKPLVQRIGTPYYIAPEVLTCRYNEKCDIWSCGVILYVLLSGYPPFPGRSDEEILLRVKTGIFDFQQSEFEGISEEAKELIRKMLVIDPNQRISAQEALKDPWIRKNQLGTINVTEETMLNSLQKLTVFHAETKLKQAILTFITSQLLNEGQSKEIRELFQTLDADGDGRLSKEELINAYSKIMSEDQARLNVEEVMLKVDADKNGFIDYSEFILATTSQSVLLSKQNMEATFQMFDKDGSGSITVEELRSILGEGSLAVADVWQQLVKEADTNGDGEIDLKEFKQMLVSVFN